VQKLPSTARNHVSMKKIDGSNALLEELANERAGRG
jgi:hypothetical protein